MLISFEGLDGSGKTTQLRLLSARLRAGGKTVVETAEPGGSLVGRDIRRLLLDSARHELAPVAELLLYCASRAQNVSQIIRPALAAGSVVLSDRFTDSTLAYQGCARGLGLNTVAELDRIATGDLKPDLTFLLDLDPGVSLARLTERNRMEQEGAEFYERTAVAYRTLAAMEPARFRVIDATLSISEVAERIWSIVNANV